MPDIRHLIQISADETTIFHLVNGGEGFLKWWAEDIFDDSGEVVSLGFFNRSTVYRLRLHEVVPRSRVVWRCETGGEWEGTQLVFDLAPKGSQTELRFTHSGWKGETDYLLSCNTTWGELMYRIKSAAEGAGEQPLFNIAGIAY